MSELDAALGLTGTGNNEVAFQWLLMSIRAGYAVADDASRGFPGLDRAAEIHQAAV